MKRKILAMMMVMASYLMYASDYVTERIRLNVSQRECGAGDTLSFDGCVLRSDADATVLSRYVYVEIISQEDSVMDRRKLALDQDGRFRGRLPVNRSWARNIYYVRAYTKLMQNFSPATFPVVPIGVDCSIRQREDIPTTLHCKFFPEGGSLIAETAQNVAAYMTDDNDMPVSDVALYLMHGSDTLQVRNTDAGGMALLSVSARENEPYTLLAVLNGREYPFMLPVATAQSFALQLITNGHRATYRLLGNASIGGKRLFCFHEDIGLSQLPLPDSRGGVIDLTGVRQQGVLSLFLTDEKGKIMSQRSVCLDVGIDDDHLWQYDLRSSVPLPKVMDKNTLQAWTMSARFERFNVQKALTEGFCYTYPYEDVLLLKGQLTDKYNRPITRGVVNALNQRTMGAYQGEVDEDGRFAIAVDDFRDGDEFFISAEKGKKYKDSGFFSYHMDDEVYPPVMIPHRVRSQYTYADSEVETSNRTGAFQFDGWNELPEVTVKARARVDNTPDMLSKKFYKNNYITVYDKDGQFMDFKSIVDRMPTIIMERYLPEDYKTGSDLGRSDTDGRPKRGADGYIYIVQTTRGQSSLLPQNVKIKLDGYYIDAEQAWFLNPNQIEDVEYLSPREALRETSGAINGLLKIRSRQADSRRRSEHKARGIWYMPKGLDDF